MKIRFIKLKLEQQEKILKSVLSRLRQLKEMD